MKLLFNAKVSQWKLFGLVGKSSRWFFGFSKALFPDSMQRLENLAQRHRLEIDPLIVEDFSYLSRNFDLNQYSLELDYLNKTRVFLTSDYLRYELLGNGWMSLDRVDLSSEGKDNEKSSREVMIHEFYERGTSDGMTN